MGSSKRNTKGHPLYVVHSVLGQEKKQFKECDMWFLMQKKSFSMPNTLENICSRATLPYAKSAPLVLLRSVSCRFSSILSVVPEVSLGL